MPRLLPLLFLASPLAAHEYQVQGLTIDHPFAYTTEAATNEAYVIFVNKGAADTLLAVTGDHDVTIAGADRVAIPAGGFAELLPGGTHLLFSGLTEAWEEGDQISATFVFENAGEVPVVFYVEERP